MDVRQDWAAVERHRYRAYGELVLTLCRTPASDPAYARLQVEAREAARRWEAACRAAQPMGDRALMAAWAEPMPPVGAALAEMGAH